jgi:mono/diheme cytochrome c family protein
VTDENHKVDFIYIRRFNCRNCLGCSIDLSGYRNHRTYEYEVEVTMADVIMTPESVENGRHVATIRGCVDCHGSNLGGDLFIEDPVVGLFVASNLTSGAGGIANDYSDADFIRAIRHGVRKDRRSVIYMPSHEYSEIDSKDMNDLIAYIRSLEPVDNELPQSRINLPFRLMYFFQPRYPSIPCAYH